MHRSGLLNPFEISGAVPIANTGKELKVVPVRLDYILLVNRGTINPPAILTFMATQLGHHY